jgi:hypothetical protein
MTKKHMDENRVKALIEEALDRRFGRGKFVLATLMQILDGRNIVLGRTTGTKIGTDIDQKLGFFGATPVTQQNIPETSPTVQDLADVLVAYGLAEQSD